MRGATRGFTLVELLVVISIISMLASVVLASLSVARDKGRVGAAQEFSANNYHAIGDRMLFWYRFNEGSGAIASDSSGNNLTAALIASPTWVNSSYAGTAGSSLLFNGSSQYISLPAVTLPVGVSGFTISAWVKISTSNYFPIVMDHNLEFLLAIGGDGNPCQVSAYEPTTDGYYDGVQNLCDSKWHNITFTVGNDKGTTAGTIYIDGKRDVRTLAGATFNPAPSSPYILNPLYIGRDDGNGYATGYANGSIDDVMAFSSILSVAQIERMYAEGIALHMAAEK